MQFTTHAYQKIGGNVDLAIKIMAAANRPTVTYDNGRFPGQRRHVRDGWVAVVAGDRVVTFYENVVETDVREDQQDPDALAFAAKQRARREARRAERRNADRALTAALKSGNGKVR